jgi:arylsulfatase A-like enzyme
MKENGYRTACIGKWHLGINFPTGAGMRKVDWKGVITDGPTAVGFTHFYGISASLDMPPFIWINDDRFVGECTVTKKWYRAGPAHKDFEAVDVLSTITKKSAAYIQANKDKPLFVYIALNSPHSPFVPSKEWVGKSKLGEYLDFVMETDWAIGQIVQAVDDDGLGEKTLIIVTSDNGKAPGGGKAISFNGPTRADVQPDKHYSSYIYRGHKADIYEGGHRVPFIARWTGKVKAGSMCNDTVCLVDLYATCAELLGRKLADKDAPDSVSMAPLLLGETPEKHREATVHHSINGSFAIRQGKWKLALCPGSGGWSYPSPDGRLERKKGIEPRPVSAIKQWVQLFDLEADSGETKNLAAEYPETVKCLTDLLQQYVDNGRSTPGAKQQNSGETHIYPDWIRSIKK